MINLLDKEIEELIPLDLLEEFNDFIDENMRDVLRANCLRRYIEGIIKVFFEKKIINISNIKVEKWKKLNLHNKIELLIKHIDKDFGNVLLDIKKIGNKGSHFGNRVDKDELVFAIKCTTNLVELIIIKYFNDNKFGSEPELMTLLSILPPSRRVYILNGIFNNDGENLNIIDKLSMAYLKNNEKNKSIYFLNNLYKDDIINNSYHEDFLWKVNNLEINLHKFDISRNMKMAKEKFKELDSLNLLDKYREFVSIFIILFSGYSKLNE